MNSIKNSKYIALILSLVFIISSCAITIQKRRYSPGFHISTTKKFGDNKSVEASEKIENPNKESRLKENNETANNKALATKEVIEKSPEIIKTSIIDSPSDIVQSIDRNETKSEESSETIVYDYRAVVKDVKPEKKKTKKSKKEGHLTKRQVALIIGVSLLLMALIAAFAFPVFSDIFVLGNPILTGTNLVANSGKFVGSILAWVGIIILDLLASWGIFKYYKKDKPNREKNEQFKLDKSKLAELSGLLRLIYTLFLIGAVIALILAKLASTAVQSYNLLSAFNSIWGWGLIVFGLHLIVLGIMYKNEGGKKWLTILIKSLLILAGIGYMLQYIGILFVANPVAFAATVESIFILFMIAGEIAFAIWMMIKGGKANEAPQT